MTGFGEIAAAGPVLAAVGVSVLAGDLQPVVQRVAAEPAPQT
jgi:hypothetical protein